MAKRKKQEKNITTEIRFLMVEHIIKTPNLPEHIKPAVIQVMGQYINFMGSYLGTLELLWRRTKDVAKEKK